MKKLICIMFLALALVLILVPVFAFAEAEHPPEVVTDPKPVPGEPLTWEYLVTIAGATAATLLIVQFLKVPLDRVWKIPTRAFVYFVALTILLVATAFTIGLSVDNALLTVVNAFVVALAAYGSYELTFRKIDN